MSSSDNQDSRGFQPPTAVDKLHRQPSSSTTGNNLVHRPNLDHPTKTFNQQSQKSKMSPPTVPSPGFSRTTPPGFPAIKLIPKTELKEMDDDFRKCELQCWEYPEDKPTQGMVEKFEERDLKCYLRILCGKRFFICLMMIPCVLLLIAITFRFVFSVFRR